jgi:hypothetical protein
VVEAAFVDALGADAGGADQLDDARRELGVAGGVVAQRPQLRIEAAEVVDRLVARRGEDDRNARGGVGRDGDDRLRPAERGVDRRAEALHERACGAGLERDHRRAVRDEERGQDVHGPLDHRAAAERFNPVARSVRDSCTVPPTAPMTTAPVRRTPSAWQLGRRQLARDFRAGELRLLAVAVMLAVAALTAVGFFADRINAGLARDARQLLGGDAIVASDQPPPADLVAKARALGLVTAPQRISRAWAARPTSGAARRGSSA